MMLRSIVRNERGGMIIMMSFTLVVLTVCGLTAYYLATTELTSSGGKFEKAKALYLAEAGLQRAIAELSSSLGNGWDDEIAGADGEIGTDDDGILSFGPQVDCSAFKHESVTDNEDISSSWWGKYVGHYDVKISDGRPEAQRIGACNRVVLSSTGVSSKEYKQGVEAEIEVFDLPMPPSLVFMVGRYNDTEFPDPFFAGQSWCIDGTDTNPDLTPTGSPSVPGIASNGPAQPIIDNLNDNQKDQLLGSGYDDTTDPITPSVAQNGMMVNLTQAANTLKGMADNIIPPGTYTSFAGYGSPDDYQITVCDGDLHLSGQVEGYGVLVVTGDLTISGQGKWEGYIICLDHVSFTGGGAVFHLFGTLMIGNSSGLDYTAEFKISGNADLFYNISNIEMARTDVRTVQVNYWRSVAVR